MQPSEQWMVLDGIGAPCSSLLVFVGGDFIETRKPLVVWQLLPLMQIQAY